jgi:ABC-type sugar transport system ATPase subunit
MARIRLQALEKRFDAQVVLSGVDLAIEEGEFFTFVGPSGCGKSTLLHLIAGIETPSAGAIWFDDARVDRLDPAQRDVAMVFQSYALYPHLSVRDNIAFPLRARRVPAARIRSEVERVAETLGLAALLERKPRQLSGGQRQRVALGRALVRRPKAFLMDEPLSNLDAGLRLEMREELKRLHEQFGVTTVYVTHDQEEAMALSDRIAVVNAGRIEQCGTPQALYEDPATLFVARFVGSPPMNLLDGAALAGAEIFGNVLATATSASAVLGVRPADVTVHSESVAGAVEAEVLVTEPAGSDLWAVGRWRDQKIKGRTASGARVRPHSTAWFSLPLERVYVFDRRSGARLRPGR